MIESRLGSLESASAAEREALRGELLEVCQSAVRADAAGRLPGVDTALCEWQQLAQSTAQRDPSAVDILALAESIKQIQMGMAQALEEMRDIKGDLRELKSVIGAHTEMLSTIICGKYNVPALPFLAPAQPKSGAKWFNPKRLFQDEMRLYFICPVTMQIAFSGPDGKGYKLVRPKAWVTKIAPLLAVGAAIIRTALTVYGIPFPIPSLSNSAKLGFLDEMTNGLVSSVLTDSTLEDFQEDALNSVLSAMETVESESPHDTIIEAGKKVNSATRIAYTELHNMLAELEGAPMPVRPDWYALNILISPLRVCISCVDFLFLFLSLGSHCKQG